MAMGKGTVNKVILVGRLGQDPELKYTPSGSAVANFSLATNRVWKDQDGNTQEKTDWHRLVVWRKSAEIANTYLKKGSQIFVEGRLETRSWTDKNEVVRYTTEVVVENFQMLGGKGERTTDSGEIPPHSDEFPPDAQPQEGAEDDLPF
ncbi:MAG: single-stranded DNA-binding protein [Candidatus Zhuqueibacterota bacterium]